MASWNEPSAEARDLGTTFEIVRRKYLWHLVDGPITPTRTSPTRTGPG
jgi:hypothetical protein